MQTTDSNDFQLFGELCRHYVDWCQTRYRDLPWLVEEIFGHQELDQEVQLLSVKYATPYGKTLLMKQSGSIIGGGAYRRIADAVCEMKRVYVVDHAKGQRLGKRLVEALLESAQAESFAAMQLDTGNLLTEEISLYTQMGFVRCEPFHDYPEQLMPYLNVG